MGIFKSKEPATPVIPAPPPPAATQTSVEVTQAKLDAKRQAKAKTGINSTILAGSDSLGGAMPGAGKNTLLGGG